MTVARRKEVTLPSFQQVEVRVSAVSRIGEPVRIHDVVVMDLARGEGRRMGLDYAEEEARAVLKVIARHRSKLARDARKTKEA